MQQTATFEAYTGDRFIESTPELMRVWEERIRDAAAEQQELLMLHLNAHMPELLRQVGAVIAVRDPEDLMGSEDFVASLGALARLRYRAGATPVQVMREFGLLAQLLDEYCMEWLRGYDELPPLESVVRVVGRLNRVPMIMADLSLVAYWDEAAQSEQPRLREFADMVAHELNTPLNAAAVSAQLLEYANGGGPTAEARRLAGLIRRNLQQADAVLRDVRSASLGMPAERLASEPFGQVLGDVLAETRGELRRAAVQLEVDEPVPPLIVDGPRVRIVLGNLLRNSARYSDPSRPLRRVRISFQHDVEERLWWVCVRDNGLGIPHEHQPHIFQRFFRAHRDRAPGSGLGLVIARQEVELMGGRIEFESEPGVGTTFRFSIPEDA